MSLSADYIVHSTYPEYSLAVHLYIDDEKRINKVSFSVLKIIEDKTLNVVPVYDLYNILTKDKQVQLLKEVSMIHNRVTGSDVNLQIIFAFVIRYII